MRISEIFKLAQIKNQKLFIPYVNCGDPTLDITENIILELVEVGADIIELGVPFSDPLADGVVNQDAAERALKNNVSLLDCCALVKKLRDKSCHVPIILFTYFNPVMRLGFKTFAAMARKSGVDSVLVVDLPLEEFEILRNDLVKNDIGVIHLIAPTTSKARIVKSAKSATEFLYYISRTGTTGIQTELSSTMQNEIQQLRALTNMPIAVGFGISTPQQAAIAAQYADGVIIGSALAKILEGTDKVAAKKELIFIAKQFSNAVKFRNLW